MTFEAVCGYAVVLTYMAETGYDIDCDDDVLDAVVALTAEHEHFTDEELQLVLQEFRRVQAEMHE